MKPITISIESEDGEFPGTFVVEQDGKSTNGMAWDELLGQIASMTFPAVATRIQQNGGAIYPMRTQEDWEALRRAAEERRAQRQREEEETIMSDYDIPW